MEPFVDDMSVFSITWEDHVTHEYQFWLTIKKSGLNLSLTKCNHAKFVDHVVESGTIEPDQVKI